MIFVNISSSLKEKEKYPTDCKGKKRNIKVGHTKKERLKISDRQKYPFEKGWCKLGQNIFRFYSLNQN